MVWRRVSSYAKIKAKYGQLLFRQLKELEKLTYHEIIVDLAKKGYLGFIKAEEFHNPIKVEYSLRLWESEQLMNLYLTYPNQFKGSILVTSYLLDYYNIKAILSQDGERLNYLIPTFTFKPQLIEEIKQSENPLVLLKRKGIVREEDKVELEILERIVKELPESRIKKIFIDLLNIRLKLEGINRFFRGGRLKKEEIENINSLEDACKLLKLNCKSKSFEDLFYEVIVKEGEKAMNESFLSKDPFIVFPFLLHVEVDKLSALVAKKYLEEELSGGREL